MADADGNNLVQISREAPAGWPRWSPDSQRIVFQMFDKARDLNLYTANISDLVAQKLNTNIHELEFPYWSHDGKWIYFEGNGHQLYRCPATEATQLFLPVQWILPMRSIRLTGKALYFPAEPGRREHDDASAGSPWWPTAQEVPQMPGISELSQWAVVAEGIYFTRNDSPRSVSFYDFATK